MRKKLHNEPSSGCIFTKMNTPSRKRNFPGVDLEETLNELLDEAVKRGLIEDSVVYRDLLTPD